MQSVDFDSMQIDGFETTQQFNSPTNFLQATNAINPQPHNLSSSGIGSPSLQLYTDLGLHSSTSSPLFGDLFNDSNFRNLSTSSLPSASTVSLPQTYSPRSFHDTSLPPVASDPSYSIHSRGGSPALSRGGSPALSRGSTPLSFSRGHSRPASLTHVPSQSSFESSTAASSASNIRGKAVVKYNPKKRGRGAVDTEHDMATLMEPTTQALERKHERAHEKYKLDLTIKKSKYDIVIERIKSDRTKEAMTLEKEKAQVERDKAEVEKEKYAMEVSVEKEKINMERKKMEMEMNLEREKMAHQERMMEYNLRLQEMQMKQGERQASFGNSPS